MQFGQFQNINPNNVSSFLAQYIQPITQSHVNNNILSNVVITTDEHDLETLKTYKLEDNLDIKCCICMGDMKKDEILLELNCSHTFHSDCIKPYLEQYNYKCPICRDEVGKAKYNI
jgi:hypothetical protein